MQEDHEYHCFFLNLNFNIIAHPLKFPIININYFIQNGLIIFRIVSLNIFQDTAVFQALKQEVNSYFKELCKESNIHYIDHEKSIKPQHLKKIEALFE